jgi:hypothetical protein
MEPGFMLADTLATAWFLGDAPLRADLQAAIRSYTARNPLFPKMLRAAMAARPTAFRASEFFQPVHELASGLSAAWLLADFQLRLDLEQAIRSYAQRHPEVVPMLKRVADARGSGVTSTVVWRMT